MAMPYRQVPLWRIVGASAQAFIPFTGYCVPVVGRLDSCRWSPSNHPPRSRCIYGIFGGPFIPDMQWPADDQEITHLPEHSSLGAGLANLLRQVSPVHRATDPPLRQEPSPRGGDVTQKRVVEIPMARRQVFLGLRGEQQSQVTARTHHGESPAGELVQKCDPLVQGSRGNTARSRICVPAWCDTEGRRKPGRSRSFRQGTRYGYHAL